MTARFALALTLGLVALAPTTAASPLTCVGTCYVDGNGFGFVPPALVVAEGADVVWRSLDVTHVNQEMPLMDEIDSCFLVSYSPILESPPVEFHIVSGTLEATTDPGTPNATTQTCTTAQERFNGSFVIAYYCVLHPTLMRGAVVVEPAP